MKAVEYHMSKTNAKGYPVCLNVTQRGADQASICDELEVSVEIECPQKIDYNLILSFCFMHICTESKHMYCVRVC